MLLAFAIIVTVLDVASVALDFHLVCTLAEKDQVGDAALLASAAIISLLLGIWLKWILFGFTQAAESPATFLVQWTVAEVIGFLFEGAATLYCLYENELLKKNAAALRANFDITLIIGLFSLILVLKSIVAINRDQENALLTDDDRVTGSTIALLASTVVLLIWWMAIAFGVLRLNAQIVRGEGLGNAVLGLFIVGCLLAFVLTCGSIKRRPSLINPIA
eukprot:m.467541 g.467541  ORF g.467541 m.467541 type:complete len:219 (+) comp26471_c0_seq1:186-842(+)